MQNFTKGNITKQILTFMVPVLLGNALQRIYTLVDTMMVGRLLGTESLAAVGASSVIAIFFMVLCNGFTSGFSIVVGQYYGAGDMRRVKNALAGTYVLSLLIAIILTAFGLLAIRPLLTWTKVPAEITDLATNYLTILTIGLGASLVYNMMANVLRTLGDSVAPLIFLIVSVSLNIVLDYIFIAILKTGVKGVAFATIIAQAVSAISCIIFSINKRPILSVKKQDFYMQGYLIKQLLSQGGAMCLMLSVVSIGSVILQSGINILGSDLLAGYTAGRKYLEFFMMPGAALAVTAAAFTSQNYGAGEFDRIKKGTRTAISIGFIWSSIAIAIVYLFGRFFVTSITGKNVAPEIIQDGVLYMRVGIPVFYALIVLVITRSTLQGMNRKKTPVIASVIELVVKIFSVAFIVPRIGYMGICITEPIIWILGAVWVYTIFRIALKQCAKQCA